MSSPSMVAITRFKLPLTREQLCVVFCIEATLIPFVESGANEEANCQGELSSDAINPEVVCRDDDAHEGKCRIQKY